MMYQVTLSAQANDDLRAIYEYIAYELRATENAKAQLRRLEERICALEEMPERHRRYEDEPWRTRGLRLMPADHYLVFYIVDQESGTVNIVRILYGGCDIFTQLERYMGKR